MKIENDLKEHTVNFILYVYINIYLDSLARGIYWRGSQICQTDESEKIKVI